MPTVAYVSAQQIMALIYVCNNDYVIQPWHGALLTMAVVLCAIFFNTWAIGKLPVLEGLAVILHIFGFFAFMVILWVMGPRADATDVFTNFQDGNNWGSLGLATLIGIVGPTTTYLGADSAVHLSEELKDAGHVLPRAMFSAAVINYILGFTTTVTFMFNLGNIEEDLSDLSGQPWVAVIYRITGSKAATIVLLCVMIVMVCLRLTSYLETLLLTVLSTSSALSTRSRPPADRSMPSLVTRVFPSTASSPVSNQATVCRPTRSSSPLSLLACSPSSKSALRPLSTLFFPSPPPVSSPPT